LREFPERRTKITGRRRRSRDRHPEREGGKHPDELETNRQEKKMRVGGVLWNR